MIDEGKFLCNWCDELKPIEERREITDETEYVLWTGCKDCHKKKLRL